MSYPFTAVVSNEYNTPYAGVNATCAEITSTRKGNGRNYFFNFGIYTFYKISVDFMSVSAYTNCVGINDFFWAGRKTQVLHWRGSSPPFFTNSQPSITKLNQELSYLSLDNLCIHTGPIIRREEIYKNMTIKERRHIFNKMVAFIRQINIRYKCFYIEKKNTSDVVEATGKLSKQISQFIHDHYEDFLSFDDVKIYYDNGQVEVS